MPKLSRADQVAEESANAARLRKERALADIREMERDEKQGLLIPAEKVSAAWAKILAEVRSAVLRVPDNCATAVAATDDARKARNILASECEAILRNLSNDVRKLTEEGY